MHDLQPQRHRRLVVLTRVLLVGVLAGVGSLAPFVGATQAPPLLWPSFLGLVLLAVAYGCVLVLARLRRWGLAHGLLYLSWLLYGLSLLLMVAAAAAVPLLTTISFSVATIFMGVASTGVVVLEPPRRAGRWSVAFVCVYVASVAHVALTRPTPMESMSWWVLGSGCAVLLVALNLATWSLSRDLYRALEDSEARRREEVELRLQAQRAREEADAANRAKDDFLARVSHEIRTPMNSVLSLSELLTRNEGDPIRRRQAELVHRSAGSLLTLINDLLDVSRFSAVGVELRPEPVELRRFVADVVEMFQPMAAERGLALNMELDPVLPWGVLVDPDRLRQVLVNLIGNALKFTREGGVTVGLSAVDGRLRFEVRDTGPGIPADEIERLFEPFAQAEEGATRAHGGVGLGLAIVRQIVETMGDGVRVESTVGRGTRFWFELDLPRAPEPADECAAGAPPVAAASPKAPPADGPGGLLLVDDNPLNREVGEGMLDVLGWQTQLAASGPAALEAVQARAFDMVLLDCHMPGWDGFRTAAELRAWWSEVGVERPPPVIALTADARPGFREKVLAQGMDDYMTKPISFEGLRELLDRWGLSAPEPPVG